MSVVSNIKNTVSGKAKELSQKAKIMSETNSLNNIVKGEECKIDFQYKTIGKLYFEKFGDNPSPEFAEAVEIIKASKEKIEQTKQEIAKIRSRYNCPACGEPFKNGAVFCSKCGEKLPEVVEEVPAVPDNAQKCEKCGNILKKEALFCNVCGNKLGEQAAEIAEAAVVDVKEEEIKPVEEKPVAEVKTEAVEEKAVEVKTEVIEEKNAESEVKKEAVDDAAESTEKTEASVSESSEKVCPNCENKMYAEDIFCNECGTKVE